jgi:hypothetical protein
MWVSKSSETSNVNLEGNYHSLIRMSCQCVIVSERDFKFVRLF